MTTPWIIAMVALWIVVVLLTLLMVGVLRRMVPVLADAEAALAAATRSRASGGLAPGTYVPAFAVSDIAGSELTDVGLRGSPSVVLFLGSRCPACEMLSNGLLADAVPSMGATVVVVTNDVDLARGYSGAAHVRAIIFDEAGALATAFKSDRTPHTFVLDADLRVLATSTPGTWESLREFTANAIEEGGEVALTERAEVLVT